MPIQAEYYEAFPVTLFECFDQKTPMHLMFSLKKPYDEIEEILKILCQCGAKIGFNKRDTTVYSAVITDHNEVVDFYGPAFNIKFITDCLQTGKLQDIGKYRQEATKHLKVEDGVCMQVVYYRKFGWDSVVREEDKRWIDYSFEVDLIKDEPVNCSGSPRTRLEENTEEKETPQEVANTTSKIESAKQIFSNTDNSNEEITNGMSEESRRSDDKSECRTSYSQFESRAPLACSSASRSPSKKRSKLPLDLLDIEGSDSEETKSVTPPKKLPPKQPYTEEERRKILKYIVIHQEYTRLKGRELWVIMEQKKVCYSRTWQSMREHFLKKIVFNLDGYDFLTNEQKRKIQRVCF